MVNIGEVTCVGTEYREKEVVKVKVKVGVNRSKFGSHQPCFVCL